MPAYIHITNTMILLKSLPVPRWRICWTGWTLCELARAIRTAARTPDRQLSAISKHGGISPFRYCAMPSFHWYHPGDRMWRSCQHFRMTWESIGFLSASKANCRPQSRWLSIVLQHVKEGQARTCRLEPNINCICDPYYNHPYCGLRTSDACVDGVRRRPPSRTAEKNSGKLYHCDDHLQDCKYAGWDWVWGQCGTINIRIFHEG